MVLKCIFVKNDRPVFKAPSIYNCMRIPLLVTCGLLSGCLITGCSQPQKPDAAPVRLIMDTDIGPDYDDVGAMAVLHALADSGYAKPLAVISCNINELTVPVIDIINTYFGRAGLPTGAPKNMHAPDMKAPQGWPELLVEKYPHTIKSTADAPDAVSVYRRVLAAQPDTSVTIVTVGFLTNLSALLDSKPDAESPLRGKDLVSRKVRKLVSMAGKFPEGREFNVYIDSTAAEKVFSEWPTEIIFSGFEIGQKVITGLPLVNASSVDTPVKTAYAKALPHWKSDSLGRNSWDQTAVLVAIRGADPYYSLRRGRYISKGGNNGWLDDPEGPHAYLTEKMPVQEVAGIIEDLMHHQK